MSKWFVIKDKDDEVTMINTDMIAFIVEVEGGIGFDVFTPGDGETSLRISYIDGVLLAKRLGVEI